jgi:hypothetical protein
MAMEGEAPTGTGEPRLCSICQRPLNIETDPLSADTGGDCWGCISEIEAGMLDAPLDEYRLDPLKWTTGNTTRSRPGE